MRTEVAGVVVVGKREIPEVVEAEVKQGGITEVAVAATAVAEAAAAAVDTSSEAEAGEEAGIRPPTTEGVGEEVGGVKEGAGTTIRASVGGKVEAVVVAAPTGTIVGAGGGGGKGAAAEDAAAALTVEGTTIPQEGKPISAPEKAPAILAQAWLTAPLERGHLSRAATVVRRGRGGLGGGGVGARSDMSTKTTRDMARRRKREGWERVERGWGRRDHHLRPTG